MWSTAVFIIFAASVWENETGSRLFWPDHLGYSLCGIAETVLEQDSRANNHIKSLTESKVAEFPMLVSKTPHILGKFPDFSS